MALFVGYVVIGAIAYMFGGIGDLIKVQFMMFMGYAYIKWCQESERREEKEDIFYGD